MTATDAGPVRIDRVGPDVVRLALVGEIDVCVAPLIQAALRPHLVSPVSIELDLAAVTFMDTTGTKPLIDAAVLASHDGTEFSVVAWSAQAAGFRDVFMAMLERALGPDCAG